MKVPALKMWLIAFAMALVALGFWSFSGGGSSLVKRATSVYGPNAILSNDQTYSGYFAAKYHYAFKHFWLSEDQLFLNYNLEHNQLKFRTLKLDIASGTEMPLPNLERLFDNTNTERPFHWQMSPDGHWLLTVSTEGRNVIFATVDLNGVVGRTWTNRWMNTRPIWLSHSRGFMEQVFDDGKFYVRLYNLDSSSMELLSLDVASSIPPDDFGEEPMAVLPDSSRLDLAELVSFHFSKTNAAMRKFSFRVPREFIGSDWTIFPSPKGDRLAWLAFYEQKVPHIEIQRDFPFIQSQPRHVGCVWLSRTDGTELRQVGRLRAGEEVRRVAWKPNGRHLSFVLREKVWVVPMP